MTLFFKKINSPVGKLKLVASDRNVIAVMWQNESKDRLKLEAMQLDKEHHLLLIVEKQLGEYFSGQRKKFDLPMKPEGTSFQVKVWQSLQAIPFGETRCYEELAKTIGSPKASRAVGSANRRNPLSILIPCHRVIGKNGSLTGFAGGLTIKQTLLTHEAEVQRIPIV